jgi:hypothetical protein
MLVVAGSLRHLFRLWEGGIGHGLEVFFPIPHALYPCLQVVSKLPVKSETENKSIGCRGTPIVISWLLLQYW